MPSTTNISRPISETTFLLDKDKNNDCPTVTSSALTTASLAFALLTQSYLLVSVFPYSGFLAMHLVDHLDEETAGSYAGLIASSFMLGRTLSSFEWGKAADKYGRVFVIKVSLLLSAFFSVLFGLAPTFSLALLTRFLLGVCNGLIGPIKTIVSELAQGDKAKETNMMALVMGMWGYGFLINPAVSGYLSDPVKQYPQAEWVQLLEPLLNLQANPFLLPNIMGSIFCLVGFVLVHYHVQETLPEAKRQSFLTRRSVLLRKVSSWGLFKHLHTPEEDILSDKKNVPKWIRPSPSTTALCMPVTPADSMTNSETQLEENEDHTDHDPENWQAISDEQEDPTAASQNNDEHHHEQPATIRSLWNRPSTRQHLLVYWVYSFLVISVDETFPLFCISKDSGLGIQEKMIGNILSGTGICYITIQYFLLTQLVSRFGFYTSLKVGALFSVPLVALLPISLWTNQGTMAGTLNWATLTVLSVLYALMRAFSSVTFSTITMTTNRTVPAHHRAAMNGLSMLGGSLAKAAGPAFAGILFSTSVAHITPPYGSVLVYSVIAVLGLGLFLQTVWLPEHRDEEEEEELEKKRIEAKTAVEEDKPPSF